MEILLQAGGGILLETWQLLKDASFYMLAGFFAAGLIEIFLDEEVISRRLGKSDLKSVLWASLLGVPLPLCSCGVLPAAAALRRKGASKGATISFLISTPESGVDSFFLSLALLDPIMAFYRPLAAFGSAVLAGVCENIFGTREPQHPDKQAGGCSSCGAKKPEKVLAKKLSWSNFWRALRFAFIEMPADIGKWLAAGLLIAAFISYAIPETFIERYLDSNLAAMLAMLAVGIPMYICASASTPIAAALILKGLNPGAALVFLLAGPATNAAGLAVIGKLMGRRTAGIYITSISVTALALGAFLDMVYVWADIHPGAVMGHAAHFIPDWLGTISAVAFIALLAYSFMGKKPSCTAD